MSNDWIKYRVSLPEDPAVIQMATELSLDEYSVAGRLAKIWGWADQHIADGDAPGVTETFLDRLIGVTGFAKSMVNVGWLVIRNGPNPGISFPNYERHMSQNAKRRALTAKRTQDWRDASSVTGASPEKEKEKEKDEEERKRRKRKKNPPAEAGVTVSSSSLLLSRWNDFAKTHGLNEIRAVSAKRLKCYGKRVAEHGEDEYWRLLDEACKCRSPWARGKLIPTFSQAVDEETFQKLIEGNYRDNGTDKSEIQYEQA